MMRTTQYTKDDQKTNIVSCIRQKKKKKNTMEYRNESLKYI